MKRGDIVTVAAGSGFGGESRPALIIQHDDYLEISTVLLALICSDDRASRLSVSVMIDPTPINGLKRRSYVTVHELVTVRVEKLDKHIGVLGTGDLRRVDRALIMFMGLDRA